jgi:hypothetical protein
LPTIVRLLTFQANPALDPPDGNFIDVIAPAQAVGYFFQVIEHYHLDGRFHRRVATADMYQPRPPQLAHSSYSGSPTSIIKMPGCSFESVYL